MWPLVTRLLGLALVVRVDRRWLAREWLYFSAYMPLIHSYLSAVIASTFVALRAGI